MTLNCGHCNATPEQSLHMVELTNGSRLCNKCISEIHTFFQSEAGVPPSVAAAVPASNARRTPRDIIRFLDEYVIGQTDAKETLALAVYNHYKRLDTPSDVELEKSNVLMLGPTGTGKTLLARSVARLLDVPFTIADATSLTQAGYVGDDVETILQRLIQAADGDIAKAERGIVFIDEIDKVAKANAGSSITRDVSGEGVQQALLKLIEGTRVSVMKQGNRKTPGADNSYIDTTNILFICAGAFVSLLQELKTPTTARIGFTGTVEPTAAQAEEVTPEMLSKFGMIPEFVGRMPVITTLQELSVEDIEHILVEPKNAILRQMEALIAMDDAKLVVEPGAVRVIAEQAFKLKTGARAARGVLEKRLKPALLKIPGTTGAVVTLRQDLAVDVEFAQLKLAA